MGLDAYANCNATADLTNYDYCTLETCCLAQSSFNYLPSLAGNVFFTALFGALFIPQVILGVFYRTWGFMAGMLFGLALEVVGYYFRTELHANPWNSNAFLLYLICLTIAPVFISAAIYLSLTRTIALYGTHTSRFAPRTIALTFMTSDFLSLFLQAAGGALADQDDNESLDNIGRRIMIAGLILQVVSLALFLLLSIDFAFRCRRQQCSQDLEKVRVRNSVLFRACLAAFALATVAILVRSVFRAAELWQGFDGSLWNNQTAFMILDGGMISIASILLTVLHPGITFSGQWAASGWTFRTKKTTEKLEHAPMELRRGGNRYMSDEEPVTVRY